MPLDDLQWDSFLSAINGRNCCLVLGPELTSVTTSDGRNISVMTAFSEYMNKRLDEEGIPHNESIDNFYYKANKFINAKYPTDQAFRFQKEIRDFYDSNTLENWSYVKKLVRLPFNTIVNFAPDDIIQKALTDQGYEIFQGYFDFSNPEEDMRKVPDEMQLVYNVFGVLTKPKSIAVTERQQLKMIKHMVMGYPKLPDYLTTRFIERNDNENKSFLFLGFNFNDWFYRLIIDTLGIPKPVHSYYPVYSSSHQVAFLNQEFYTEKFGIQFIAPDTDTFIGHMIAKYETVFGSLDKSMLMMIDYHESDVKVFTELKMQLALNGISRRVTIWDKTNLIASDPVAAIDQKAKEADIYVCLLSSAFLNDVGGRGRLTKALNQQRTRVIPMYSSFGAYEAAIPSLAKKSLKMLPVDKRPLSAPGDDLDQRCYQLATLMNCIIR